MFLFCSHSLCNRFPLPTCLLVSLPSLRPVHSAAVLRARAEDVPGLQHLRFVPLHAATRAPDGCCRTGLLFSPAGAPAWPICVHVTLHPSLSTDCWFILIYKSIKTVVTFPIGSCPSGCPVACLKMGKLCLMWQKGVWTNSQQWQRPPCAIWPRRPLPCHSSWLRCEDTRGCSLAKSF